MEWAKVDETVLPKQLRLDDLNDKQKKLIEDFKETNKNEIKPYEFEVVGVSLLAILMIWTLRLG
jgi:hypothetical protein